MKLINNGVNHHRDSVEVQVSLNDIHSIVKESALPLRHGERVVKASLELSAIAGGLSHHTNRALFGKADVDPAVVFAYSKDLLKVMAELATACGYELDQLGESLLRDSVKADDED